MRHRLGLATRTQISVCKSPLQCSVPVPCENGSAETTVAEGGQNSVAGLWGRTLREHYTNTDQSSMLDNVNMHNLTDGLLHCGSSAHDQTQIVSAERRFVDDIIQLCSDEVG